MTEDVSPWNRPFNRDSRTCSEKGYEDESTKNSAAGALLSADGLRDGKSSKPMGRKMNGKARHNTTIENGSLLYASLNGSSLFYGVLTFWAGTVLQNSGAKL